MMKIMRPKNFLILLIFVGYSSCFSQVLKMKAFEIAFKYQDEYSQQWKPWSDWEDVDILITIDSDPQRIKVFSKKEQIYDVIQYKGETTNSDGDITSEWLCVNEDGRKCGIRIVIPYKQSTIQQLYVDFSDFMFVYNIYKLD